MNGISVVVPCHNEERSIKEVLTSISDVCQKLKIPFEIVVVNDGSTDHTADLLREFEDQLTILRRSVCLGYGASIKTGVLKANYDNILIIDADGTYQADDIPKLVATFLNGRFDMVVGARIKSQKNIPWLRKPAKWFINSLANYLSGRKIPDLNSGLRIMKKEIFIKFISMLPDGFSLTTTITLAMLTNNYAVEYLPIEYRKRIGKSKIRPLQDTSNFVLLVLRTVMYFNPLKIFLQMSLLMFFAGFILLGLRLFFGKMLISTTITIFVGAFTVLSLGLLADLIVKRIR